MPNIFNLTFSSESPLGESTRGTEMSDSIPNNKQPGQPTDGQANPQQPPTNPQQPPTNDQPNNPDNAATPPADPSFGSARSDF